MAKLTDRERRIISAAALHAITDVGKEYIRLGGYGTVGVRYHFATLRNLVKRGLLSNDAGIYRATDAGKAEAAS